MHFCKKCGIILTEDNFTEARKRQYKYMCSPCYNAMHVAYQTAVRTEALAHYGGRCSCCGEDRYEFLALDHINGGGRQHQLKEGYTRLGYWLKRHGYPEGYRVLCHNCNQALGSYGYCPHDKGEKDEPTARVLE